jgi:hypothetical protein
MCLLAQHLPKQKLPAQSNLSLVIASFAAGFAVKEAVAAEAHALKAVAQAAVFGAGAFIFRTIALLAGEARVGGSHGQNLTLRGWGRQYPW